jgi:2-dehydro-3-deoxygluconokinase
MHPNFRGRPTTPHSAAAFFRSIAPSVTVAIPSSPGDTQPLFGLVDAAAAAAIARSLGVGSAVVTCGGQGALVSCSDTPVMIPVVPAPRIVDSTGAGDCFAGALTALLALGDDLLSAVSLAMAAASLSLAGQGGTGLVPNFEQTRAHLARAKPHVRS